MAETLREAVSAQSAAAEAADLNPVRARRVRRAGRGRAACEEDLMALLHALERAREGDFAVRLDSEQPGLLGDIGKAFNALIGQNEALVKEFGRVGRSVGREGRMNVRVSLAGAPGAWSDAAEAYNALIGDLVQPMSELGRVIDAIANGDLSQQMPLEIAGRPIKGEFRTLALTVNTMVEQLRDFAAEVTRVAKEVGVEGKLGGQARVPGVSGTWKDLTESVNSLAANLTTQVRNIALVTTAVAKGDLSQKITVEARGEILELKNTINVMVDQLRAFGAEVTRMAKEVGVEGKLGGQAHVPGVSGTWKDLTESVNSLAANLTSQVRNIALVTTAVAKGDLSQKITVEARGEIMELKNTINVMVDQLRAFGAEVTRVAKEVGVEGKLGGQARVPGVAGTWQDLTENVNQLASNLTTQVRAIAEVSTAVARGDLTRFITVEAQGEVLALKDNINQMIANLRETTQKNREQDWLKTNLAHFQAMMQGQRNLKSVCQLIMSELTPLVSAQHGAFFLLANDQGERVLELIASYAYSKADDVPIRFRLGQGLVGQCALEKHPILLLQAPPDYIRISSGLGSATPSNILALPILFEGKVLAVIELASFQPFSEIHRIFLDQLTVSIGVVVNIIGANMRTEELLQELQRSNSGLEAQAAELEEKAKLLQVKNREVEFARLSLEEKAEQLAMISKYKSEFLANMSHELRTPLNSLLIMAKLLADNQDKNLTSRQIEFANMIQASGRDLLSLINEILDLAKVEAGKMVLAPDEVLLAQVFDHVGRDFRPVAQQKGLNFKLEVAEEIPATMYTDGQRLQQVLRNLLSNAFKFTSQGEVKLSVRRASEGELQSEALKGAEDVLAFEVRDTGIGIAPDKQQLIFEAFQQVDATTSRKYGGTGLGLTISRELARLLGGEIRLDSNPGRGSVFTLFVPRMYEGKEPEPSEALKIGEVEYPEYVPVHENSFDGEKVLIVDDDVRNIFALASALENQKLRVLFAENGQEAIDLLQRHSDVSLILMDIMMPEMDGYETTRVIRAMSGFENLPIIAVTAKAMKGDREKCLEAGVSDYITKPVDIVRLSAMVRHWLRQAEAVNDQSEGVAEE